MNQHDNLKKILQELGLDLDKIPLEIQESSRSGDLMIALLVQEVRGLKETNKESHKIIFERIKCFEQKFNDRDGKPGIFSRLAVLESGQARLWIYYGFIAFSILSLAVYSIREHLWA